MLGFARVACRIMVLGAIPWVVEAQAPDTLWTRTFGGPLVDVGYTVAETWDHGYVVGGSIQRDSANAAIPHAVLIRTTATGDTLWTRVYAPQTVMMSLHPTADGGYVWVGTYMKTTLDYDVLVVKTSADGTVTWSRTLGGPGNDQGYAILQTSDGGYVGVGVRSQGASRGFDVFLFRLDSLGNVVWERTPGGYGADMGYGIRSTPDGGYIVVGATSSWGNGSADVYLVRTDSAGNVMWEKTYGNQGYDEGQDVQITPDGGFVIVGSIADSATGVSDVYVVRTDASGDTLWTRRWGGNGHERGECIRPTPDGGWVVGGQTASYGTGGYDLYVLRMDAQGDTLWTWVMGGAASEAVQDLVVATDSTYVLAGFTESLGAGMKDIYLLKLAGGGTGVLERRNTGKIRSIQIRVVPRMGFQQADIVVEGFRGPVAVDIVDGIGRVVQQVRALSPGLWRWTWRGDDEGGHPVHSGWYRVSIRAGTLQTGRPVLILKPR